MSSETVTGYYRYTDIWFEWFKVIEGDDRFLIKASFAHDALVHPDHPLHKEGVKGIEMYTGTLQNGETRLLFSSAQVDYVRYWLRAMKLTENYIPLPYSECLLTASDLRTIGPIVFEDGGALRRASKKIEKNNKRLKGTNQALNLRRDTFERVRTLWSAKMGTWCALDFESWDRDHSIVTEFGWSLVRWENGHEVGEKGHLVVNDYFKFTNTFVPNHREYYNFGASEAVSKEAFKTRICNLISQISTGGPLFLVFHDNSQDIKYLRQHIGIPLADLSYQMPESTPLDGMFVVDTSVLFAALEGDGDMTRRSLDRVCKHLQIPTRYLHNAGNDAHYTFLAMKSMASGEPVDLQRETRWPNRTESTGTRGPKVQFQPWEENSDYSDLEGVVSPSCGYDPVTGRLISGTV